MPYSAALSAPAFVPSGVQCVDRAEQEIDMAAYVLTDWPIPQALTRAADRGVAIRIYLDGTQLAERERAKVFHPVEPAAAAIASNAFLIFLVSLSSFSVSAARPALRHFRR
jgi:hypothetical protein